MPSPKYGRTLHLPWSAGKSSDDKVAISVESLLNIPIIITEKLDGSNSSIEHDGCFARTHAATPTHASFDTLKALHAAVKHLIPPDVQLFGENVYAKHSIEYSELPGYFMLFGVRNLNYTMDLADWASWEEVEIWAQEIGVPTVPVLFRGQVSSAQELQKLTESFMIKPSCCGGIREGVVVRIATGFDDADFSKYVQKAVRANHVQTSDHWAHQTIVKNKLKVYE